VLEEVRHGRDDRRQQHEQQLGVVPSVVQLEVLLALEELDDGVVQQVLDGVLVTRFDVDICSYSKALRISAQPAEQSPPNSPFLPPSTRTVQHHLILRVLALRRGDAARGAHAVRSPACC
jgi:hypothetical protein